jgi:hypothetical protein
MRRLVLLVGLVLGLLAAPGEAAVGDVRLLVVRLTWGPAVSSAAEIEAQVAEADAFFRRSSFGRASLRADVTPVVERFVVPTECFAGGNADAGLGALSQAARAAAARLGYDLAVYDRFVFVFPDTVCGRGGLGVGRDVLLAGPNGLDALGLVHELGHTFRLPHAGSATCATCGIREYGDRVSVMGQGFLDFSAWEKAQLGWLDRVRRVVTSGVYPLDPVDAPSNGPQALLVRVAAGTLWIERRLMPAPRIEMRIVKRPPAGGATRAVFLATGRSTATIPGILRVRFAATGVTLTRLDHRRS